MKKLYILLFFLAIFSVQGCEKRFETSIDLGVNTRRVNMTVSAQEFWFSVFSDGQWTVSDDDAEGWLKAESHTGEGSSSIHFFCEENTGSDARYVRYNISGGSKGRSVSVYFVQAGTAEKASDVELDII